MHKLLIIGASGGIGLRTVERALEDGHAVRAVARRASAIEIDDPLLEKCDTDATDAEALRPALEGATAVIQAIGVAPSLQRTLKPVDLFSKSTAALLPEMERAGIRRLVTVTGFGAGDSRNAMSLIERTGHRALLGRAYDDKDIQEEMIRASNLDWLIVRPTILTNRPARGTYKVLLDPEEWRNGLISRADVADFLVREAVAPRHSRSTPVLTT